VVPGVGDALVEWLWGGPVVGNPTLMRFYSLHFILSGFLVIFYVLHMFVVHKNGGSNPSEVGVNINQQRVNLYPLFIIKDWLGLHIFVIIYFIFVFFYSDVMGNPDNYIPADPFATPKSIIPE